MDGVTKLKVMRYTPLLLCFFLHFPFLCQIFSPLSQSVQRDVPFSAYALIVSSVLFSEDMNQELDLHKGLLDDLGNSIDETDSRIQSNTNR